MNRQKRAWSIGKLGEKKTRELLRESGYIIIGSDVDSAGVDIIAFKNKTIYLVEVKATDYPDKKWKELISKKQFNKYKKMQNELIDECFNTKFILYKWTKPKNKWIYEEIDLSNIMW